MLAEYEIRGPQENDVNFILATWLKGFFYGTNWLNRNVDQDLFFKQYNEIAKGILIRPGVKISVCCLRDDDDVILGYSISEGDCLHWIFVKESWRKMGIGGLLLPPGLKEFSHLTDLGLELNKMKMNLKFNPFKVMGG